MTKKRKEFILRLFTALAIPLVTYFFIYRPIQMNWGASGEEIKRIMPGDKIVSQPSQLTFASELKQGSSTQADCENQQEEY